ncbi:LysR family transcriptional regulator [Novosphingobium panipatense]|uniref:LysR family transcriptional regulator n=1 Tax=Novosphingobium panipatense TaxID=428991 RepID=UPI00360F9AF5
MKRIALFHLETLMWIHRLGTFAAAAHRLNTTQPAISARVREIEEQLGVSLFQREGRRMVLSARGRRLVQASEPLYRGLEHVLLEASDFAGATASVRIGSGEIAAASCLPAFIQAVERDRPGIAMEIDLDLTARLLQQLLAGTRDIVFLAGPVASPGMKTAPIGSVELVWAAGAQVAAAGASTSPFLSGRCRITHRFTPFHMKHWRRTASPPGASHLQQRARDDRDRGEWARRRPSSGDHDP